jgi:hypothetical protein
MKHLIPGQSTVTFVDSSISRFVDSSIEYLFYRPPWLSFCTVCFLAIFLMVSDPSQTAFAQTQWMANYKTLSPTDQLNPNLARPSRTDITVTVWESDEGGEWKVFAQCIDNVYGLPQWENLDGVRVCTGSGNQRNPRAAYDSLGHVLIVWEDYRNGDNPSIFAQCLNVSDGSVAANWSNAGVAICDLDDAADQPRIAGSSDGAYIAWRDWRNSGGGGTNRDIYLSYILSQTAALPQGAWSSNGNRVPANVDADQTNVDLARDYMWTNTQDPWDRDGAILVYQDKRDSSATLNVKIYSVYATRFDAEGAATWSDVRCAFNDEEQLYPRIVVEGRRRGTGDSMAVVVWQDAREDPSAPDYDIYGQVLNKHTHALFGANPGVAICDHPYTQRYPELALYEEDEDLQLPKPYISRVTCVWEDLRVYGTYGVDVFAAVLDGTNGGHINPGGTQGEEICTNIRHQTQARVDHFPDDPNAYFVWRDCGDEAGGDDADVWYQGLDVKSWTFHRTHGVGLEVSVAKGEQTNPQAGGNVFVWADQRRQPIPHDNLDDWNIFAETPGECVGQRDMKWRDMFADVRKIGDASDMNFVADPDGNTLVVLEKATEDPDIKDVYIQKLDVDGVPRWNNSGIKLNTMDDASHPRVCRSDSSGGAQVTWQQPDADGDPEVWYAKLSPMGAYTYRGLVGGGRQPVIAYASRTYASSNQNSAHPAYIGLLSSNGEMQVQAWDSPDWIAVSPLSPINCDTILIDATVAGEFFMAGWEFGTFAELQVTWGTTTSTDPLPQFTAPVSDIGIGGCAIAADVAGSSGSPANRGGIVVYSADPLGSGRYDLYAHHIPSGGPVIGTGWQITLALPGDIGATHPAMCADSSINASGYGGMLLAWNWQYEAPGYPPQIRHHLLTNKLDYDASLDRISLVWPHDYHVSTSMPYAMHASIARISNLTPVMDTAALIVWQGVTEQCYPSRPNEIVGQWVLYDTASVDRGARWSNERPMGPGSGDYGQHRPMARTSVGNTVAVYWHDERGPYDLILGTRCRMDATDPHWMKVGHEASDAPPSSPRLGDPWPNPLILHRTTLAGLRVTAQVDQHVALDLYDCLGRRVRKVFEGLLISGTRTLYTDVADLPPGMYHYVLRGGAFTTTRKQIILR